MDVLYNRLFNIVYDNIDNILDQNDDIKDILSPKTNSLTRQFFTEHQIGASNMDSEKLAYSKSLTFLILINYTI